MLSFIRKSIPLALIIASCVAHLGLAATLGAQVNVTTTSSANGMLITEGATLTGTTTPTAQLSVYGDTTSHRIAVWNNAPSSAAYIVATWPCTLGGCMVYADPTSLGETKLDIVGAGRILTSSATAPSWSATPTLGTSTVTGTLTFQATSSHTTTLTTAAPSANRTYTFPDFGGNENITAVSGTPTSGHMTKWGSSGLLVDDSVFSDNGTTLTYTAPGGNLSLQPSQ